MPTLHQIAQLLPASTVMYISVHGMPLKTTAELVCNGPRLDHHYICVKKDCRVTGITAMYDGAIWLEALPPLEEDKEPAGE